MKVSWPAISVPLTPGVATITRGPIAPQVRPVRRRVLQLPKLTVPFLAASLGRPRELASARTARVGGHQDDEAKPRLHRGKDQKQTLAARQRVRGDITPHPPVNGGCLPEPVKSASRPSGMACGHT